MTNPSDTPGAAFSRIVGRHEPRLRAYIARRAPADAVDDVVAEVLLVAWRRRGEMPTESLPWLLGVAAKTLSTRWRTEARREALLERVAGQPPAALPSVEAEVRRREQQRALATALAALAECDRELLLLRYWDDLAPRQIASTMGLSPVTVRARLHRASLRLHRHFRAAIDRPAADAAEDPADAAAVPAA